MHGQGRPLRLARRFRSFAICGTIAWLFAALPTTLHSQEQELRLRVHWQTAALERTGLSIEIDKGNLSRLRNLSLDAGSTGGLDLSPDGKRISVYSRTASLRGGLEFVAQGDNDAVLTLQESANASSPAASASAKPATTVNLAALIAQPQSIELSGGRIQLVIDRAPGDRLRVQWDRENLIFQPGERVPLTIVPNATGLLPNQKLRLTMTLTKARSSKTISQQEWQVATDADGRIAAVDAGPLTIPDAEAAYAIHVRLASERRYLTLEVPWTQETDTIERSVQFVVLSETQPTEDLRPFIEVARIEPTKRQWWNPVWMPDRLLPGKLVPDAIPSIVPARQQPLSSEPLTHQAWQDGLVSELQPRGWQSYPLQIKDPGKPHVLVVRYPNDRPMRLGVSVMEPNASGKVIPLGVDTGVAVLPKALAAPPELLEHRIVFWPKTRQPMVLLTNFDSSKPAWFANLSIAAGPETLASEDDLAVNSNDPANPHRLAALYLDKPVLADTFGCTRAIDADGVTLIDDWQTFLEAGQRLVQYVKWAGFNGAIVTVNAEGAALYPTETMSATARHDMGIFSSTGIDPNKKDVLELLLRMFDRAGLKLVPAVELATPLTQLERALRDPQTSRGIEPINAAGHRYVDISESEHGLAPYYNPLDQRVQKAITAVIAELETRYGKHPAMHGVGVHLGGKTFMQLPGIDWGVDQHTLDEFRGTLSSAPVGSNQMIGWIEGEGHGAFLDWRGRQLAGLFAAMSQAAGKRPLLLLTADWMSDTTDGNTDPQRRSLDAGIDWESIGGAENVIPMRLHRSQPLADHARQSVDAALSQDTLWDNHLAALPASGALLMRPPTDVRLGAFESQSPWGAENTQAWLFAHGVPSSDDGKRALAQILMPADANVLAVGGWTTPRGSEAASREFLRCFRALPPGRFESVPAERPEAAQLAIVRRLRTPNAFHLYALNPAPWMVQVKIELNNPDAAPIHPLGAESDNLPATRTLTQTLLPGQIIAYRIDSPKAEIAAWNVEIPGLPALRDHLGLQLQRLTQTVGTLGQPKPYQGLPNQNFEQPVVNRSDIPGWLSAQHPPGCVQLASEAGVLGSQAVQLTNNGETNAKTWLLSNPFDAPASGRLAVHARVRRDMKTENVRLRLSLEGRYRDRSIRRSTVIGEEPATATSSDWSNMPFRLEVTDLPVEGLEELRIAFDLASPGKVWIDDVMLYDQFLTSEERKELQSRVFVAVERMRGGDLSACGRLLDSYWGRHVLGLPDEPIATKDVPGPVEASIESAPGIAERFRQWLPSPIWR
ncbi:hypothetical protein Poly24_45220 [Rosistilla carotiformis]|uniref:Glycosyl hydrolase-like 10 domain-containing protein n=1 Tax=Rosistilla carotiformis TaxID=2528017 RepID=A0A518JZ24_9BACT|nr:hypothetical protein [Rosistilla carotiformis]QDV70791.1 hypothetical protein Poly24_45220 [Rosistilla carotiformis]